MGDSTRAAFNVRPAGRGLEPFLKGASAALGIAVFAATGFAGVSALQPPPSVRVTLIEGDERARLICEAGSSRLEFRLPGAEPAPMPYTLRLNQELFASTAQWTGDRHADIEGGRRLVRTYSDSFIYRVRADFGSERIELSAREVDSLNQRLARAAPECLEIDPDISPVTAGRNAPLVTAGTDPARSAAAARLSEPQSLQDQQPVAGLRGDTAGADYPRDPVIEAAPSVRTGAPDVGDAGDAPAGPAPLRTPGWFVQVGAYDAERPARARLDALRAVAERFIAPPVDDIVLREDRPQGPLFRARYRFFSQDAAEAACETLRESGADCFYARDAAAREAPSPAASAARAPAEPAPPTAQPALATSPAAQIGAYETAEEARAALDAAPEDDPAIAPGRRLVIPVETASGVLYRARFVFDDLEAARRACRRIEESGGACYVAP